MTMLFKPSLCRMWAVLLAMCSFSFIILIPVHVQGSKVTTQRRHQSSSTKILRTPPTHTSDSDSDSDPSPQHREKIQNQVNKSWILPQGFLSLWEKFRADTDVPDGYRPYNTNAITDTNAPQHIRRRTFSFNLTEISGRYPVHRNEIGWIPSAYPSPLENPDQCRISSVSVPVPVPVPVPDSDSDGDDGGESESNTSTPNSSMLLCDPDGVLSIPQLYATSIVLQNFDHRYGRDSLSRKKIHEHEQDQGQGQGQGQEQELEIEEDGRFHPEIAVAIVSKMDLPDILRDFAFYTFEDEDDMIHDAAEYFADYLHNKWFSSEEATDNGDSPGSAIDSEAGARIANGILIFISVEDFVCFISAGNGVTAVLPWWRLLGVVDRMMESMHYDDYFNAVVGAVRDISSMLDEGPPSALERSGDFLNRFGAVLFFALAAICGVYVYRTSRGPTPSYVPI